MNGREKYEATLAAAQKLYPGFQVRYKDETWHQRVLAYVLFFTNFRAKQYRKNGEPLWDPTWGYARYTTTWGRTVYFPSREWVENRQPWKTLQHEIVHTHDFMTFYGLLPRWLWPLNYVLFALCYLFPAPLPFPSPGRTYAELRAYRRSLEVRSSDAREAKAEYYAGFFSGPDYLVMWPWKAQVMKWLLADRPSPMKSEMDSWLS